MPITNTQNAAEAQNIFIFRGNEILVKHGTAQDLPDIVTYRKCVEYQLATDWFCEMEHGYASLLLEHDAPAPAGWRWALVREMFATAHPLSAQICRALSLLGWRKKSRFCGKCGSQLHESMDETARVCLSCGSVYYPAISPAMIVLISKGEQILLARHKNRNTDIFTCLAGYIEAGETPEECVAREVREEAGIEIKDIRYKGSQSWPFPDQLMMAFTAEWKSGELTPEAAEINELRWFTRDNLPPIPAKGSVAYRLITGDFETPLASSYTMITQTNCCDFPH